MSRPIAVCADVHIGNHKRMASASVSGINGRARLVLSALQSAVDKAKDADARAFIVAGDLFDYQRPEPQLIAAVQDIFAGFKDDSSTVILLVGNHDQVSDGPGDHALGPLAPVATIVERPEQWIEWNLGIDIALVPFIPPGANVQQAIDDALRSMSRPTAAVGAKASALVVHLGIRDAKTAPWLRDSHDAIDASAIAEIARFFGRGIVFAGNWHDRRTWRFGSAAAGYVDVVQAGALCPTGWDNPGWDGYGLTLWDPEDGSYEFVEVPGPRFVKAAPGEVADVERRASRDDRTAFVEVSVGVEEARELRAKDMKLSAAQLDIVVDRSVQKAKARTAGIAARSVSGVEEAVEKYVKRMDLGEGVDRAEVASIARGLIRAQVK